MSPLRHRLAAFAFAASATLGAGPATAEPTIVHLGPPAAAVAAELEEPDGPSVRLSPSAGEELDDGAASDEGDGGGDSTLPDLAGLTAVPVRGVPSSGFGWRDDPIRHRARFHKGSDFRAPRGTPVYAAGSGVVVIGERRGGLGRMIALDHGGGVVTRYGHLSHILVKRGEAVAADTLIGLVGSTGRTTGAHLHFEVRLRGRAVDPTVAMQVGALQRQASNEVVAEAAAALRPEVQERSVSRYDPPRGRTPAPGLLQRNNALQGPHRRGAAVGRTVAALDSPAP